MANLIRRGTTTGSMAPTRVFDPFEMMRDLMRWDPFVELGTTPPAREVGFVPSFEVKETKDAYLFKADLPGIKESDLDISLTGSRLTVSGKREEEKREEKETYFAMERTYGSFNRSFTLPDGTDPEHVTANLKDGVLVITVPKKPDALPKKVPVGAGDKPPEKN